MDECVCLLRRSTEYKLKATFSLTAGCTPRPSGLQRLLLERRRLCLETLASRAQVVVKRGRGIILGPYCALPRFRWQ